MMSIRTNLYQTILLINGLFIINDCKIVCVCLKYSEAPRLAIFDISNVAVMFYGKMFTSILNIFSPTHPELVLTV